MHFEPDGEWLRLVDTNFHHRHARLQLVRWPFLRAPAPPTAAGRCPGPPQFMVFFDWETRPKII